MTDPLRKHVAKLQTMAVEACVAFNHMHEHRVGMEDFKEIHPDLHAAIVEWNACSDSSHANLVFSLCRTIRTQSFQIDNEICMVSCKECSDEKPCEFHRGFFMGMYVMGNEIEKDEDAVNMALHEICERYGIVRVGEPETEGDRP